MSYTKNKLSACLDRLEKRLDDPKEMERMFMNPIAYACFALAAATPLAVVYEGVANGRFAWWSLPLGLLAWLFGKALYIPSGKKNIPTAEEVRARFISFREEASRKISGVSSSLRSSETINA